MYVQHEGRQHRMEPTQYMDVVLCCFLSPGSTQNGYPGRAVITSLVEYAVSLCGVTFHDTLCAPRASFPRTYHHNQRVVCLTLCRQRVKHQPKEKFGLEQRSGATDFHSKGYRVSTCSFPRDIQACPYRKKKGKWKKWKNEKKKLRVNVPLWCSCGCVARVLRTRVFVCCSVSRHKQRSVYHEMNTLPNDSGIQRLEPRTSVILSTG